MNGIRHERKAGINENLVYKLIVGFQNLANDVHTLVRVLSTVSFLFYRRQFCSPYSFGTTKEEGQNCTANLYKTTSLASL